MRLIAGLEEATSGQVYFGDEDMTARSVQDRELGFLFQGYALFRHMTVAENIAFGPRVRKMDIDIDARVEELLALVGLTGYGKRYPPQLSGGQRQRVALARALGCNPQLLLLDEPFGALDPLVRKALRGSLKEIVSSIGVTTIIVTHDQEEAWDLADEVIIFNRGRIEQRGMPEQITRHPKSPFVMNFVGGVLHLPSNCQFLRRMGLAVPQPYVMIRPAHIDVHKSFEGKKNICAATVKDKSRVGWLVNYTIVFDDGVDIELTVGRKEDELFYDFAAGDRVYLTADVSNVVPFSPSEIDDPMFEEVVMLGARAA
ncbi:hypothetical protein H632_c2632p0 [Helicosporidium sp. ATCC 50920]|nr:hypothetical protein H632_c2632p0 [Helicosporidium sp. ATCC 50920]|eukprot:KDD73009.1 hypothetical protein H632_c2632p0 [Helicosporidium sp. ATCC 50920]